MAAAGVWVVHPRKSLFCRAGGRKPQVDGGDGGWRAVPGVLAYAQGEPVGWAAFGPREGYIRLEHSKSLARVDETPVWSLVCFYVARGWRRKGVTTGLIIAAVETIRAQGGQVVEAYPGRPAQAGGGRCVCFHRSGFHFSQAGIQRSRAAGRDAADPAPDIRMKMEREAECKRRRN